MKQVDVRAYGKVNLGLDVTGRRNDGYHLVKMIMQTVDLYDDITVSVDDSEPSEVYSIKISCDNPEVPVDSSNLVYKAAAMICDRYNVGGNICIDIRKRIPAAAGMAGGSADGAAVIKAMDELYGLGMEEKVMDEIALKLGADVPFCLRRGTYLSEGIGEILTKVSDLPHCYMVIIKPDFGVSTVWAYKALDEYIAMHGDTKELHPDIDKLIEALDSGNMDDITGNMGNILEVVTLEKHPELQQIKKKLEEAGAKVALMSGSGPTIFGIFEDKLLAEKAVSGFEGGNYGKFKIKF